MSIGVVAASDVIGGGGGGAAAYYTAVLADSPWLFLETLETGGPTLADASGNSRPMTVTGTPGYAGSGPGTSAVNDALGFTSAAGEYAVTTATNNSGPLTYEAWVYLDANPSGSNAILARSIGYLSSGASDAEFYVKSDGTLEWLVFDNVGTRIITSSGPLSLKVWHHVIASVGAAGMKIRVDKATVASTALYTTAYTGAAMNVFLRAGGSRMGGHDAIKISRPTVYNAQLSDGQTDAHYDAAITTSFTDPYSVAVLADSPVLWHRMDGRGVGFPDYSGNARHIEVIEGASPTINPSGPKLAGSAEWGASAGRARTSYSQGQPTIGTYEIWLKFAANPAADVALQTFDPGGGANGATSAVYLLSSGKIRLMLYNGSVVNLDAPSALSTGVWHHIVCSWGAGGSKIRVDKTTVASGATTSAINAVTSNYRLHGLWNGGGFVSQTGALQLADGAFYSTQLSDARTDAHYDAA